MYISPPRSHGRDTGHFTGELTPAGVLKRKIAHERKMTPSVCIFWTFLTRLRFVFREAWVGCFSVYERRKGTKRKINRGKSHDEIFAFAFARTQFIHS